MGMEETVDKLAPLSERQKEDFIAVATRTESERLMKVGGRVWKHSTDCMCRSQVWCILLAR